VRDGAARRGPFTERLVPALPLLGGVLLGVSYFPGPYLVLNFSAFFPLLAWCELNPDADPWRRVKAGLAFGITTELVMLHFMYSMLAWSWLAALLYVGLALLLGARIALSSVLVGWLRRRTGWSWGLLLPLAWLPLEWAQTWGDLRMTADHLGHSLAGYPFLVQFADVLGPYGVGAFLLASNGLSWELVTRWREPAGRRAACLL
jgi:apolipoprotein N-acyltransferase